LFAITFCIALAFSVHGCQKQETASEPPKPTQPPQSAQLAPPTKLTALSLPTDLKSRVIEAHSAPISAIVISYDGKTLVSASTDKSVKLWNLQTGKLERVLPTHTNGIISLSLSPDGKTLATSDSEETRLWDTSAWESKRILKEIKHRAIFWPDNKTLAEVV
jgi:WD40 repeat protein